MRRIAFIALVLVLSSFAGGQAWGGIPEGEFRVDFFECASDCESRDVTLIQGGMDCAAGQQFFIRVNLRQFGQTRAVGRASGVCTGNLQNWVTNRVDNPAPLDCSSNTIVGGGKGTVGGNPVRINRSLISCPA